ncbi:MAG: hypothetical protein U0232_09775 [Thermomicrobiales bacterium]
MSHSKGSYLLAAGYFPVIAVVLTLVCYLGASGAIAAGYQLGPFFYWTRDCAAFIGLALAIPVWWIIARIYSHYATLALANPRVYDEICHRLTQLQQHRAACNPKQWQEAEFLEVTDHLRYVEEHLRVDWNGDVRWALATGYLDLQDRLNQAEELLILLIPHKHVLSGAQADVLRLGGSDIPDRKALLSALWQAISILEPKALTYVDRLRSAVEGPGMLSSTTAAPQDHSEIAEMCARTTLRTVRQAINEYRLARSGGLVRMRNQLFSSLSLLAMLLYTIILIASVGGIPPNVLLLATAYFLVGAATGVLARLRAAPQSEYAIEDYGLANMRLATRPFTSGLAALLGIIGLSFIPLQFTGRALALDPMSATDLTTLFSPDWLGTGMLLSAIFGLTPEVVFRQFSKVAETYGKELKSSRASESAATL